MAILFLMISVLGLWEFYSLVKTKNIFPQIVSGFLILTCVFVFSVADNIQALMPFEKNYLIRLFFYLLLIFVFLLIFFLSIFELFRKKENPFSNIGYTLLGILYVAVPFALLLLIPSKNAIQFIVLGFFFLIWSNDTFAYLVGRTIGRTKLFERISPKKTWEGFIGGVICTQGIAYLISIYFTELAPIHWHVVALIVSVFGTLGDLVESMFKRSLGVKDSGTILPGHGGILDRFDGVLLSSPFVVTYLMLVR